MTQLDTLPGESGQRTVPELAEERGRVVFLRQRIHVVGDVVVPEKREYALALLEGQDGAKAFSLVQSQDPSRSFSEVPPPDSVPGGGVEDAVVVAAAEKVIPRGAGLDERPIVENLYRGTRRAASHDVSTCPEGGRCLMLLYASW